MLRADGLSGDWLADPRAAELQDARARAAVVGHRVGGVRAARRRSTSCRRRSTATTALVSFVYSADALVALVVTPGSRRVSSASTGGRRCGALMPGLRADLDMSASVRSGPAGRRRAALARRPAGGPVGCSARTAPRAAAGARASSSPRPGVLDGMPWAMLPGDAGRVVHACRLGVAMGRRCARDGRVAAPTRRGSPSARASRAARRR